MHTNTHTPFRLDLLEGTETTTNTTHTFTHAHILFNQSEEPGDDAGGLIHNGTRPAS